MQEPLDEILGPRGAAARALGGYEHRPQQQAMAEQVAAALQQGHPLVIEAGTGTGKTLAYLVPAALSGRKVVVSTATKTLQEQLANKDIPALKALGIDVKAAFMKGRQNYLCLLRKEQFEAAPEFAAPADEALYRDVQAWALETTSGDRAELELPESFAPWREISSTAETCIGQKCPHYDPCFVFKMRKEAQSADLVVVNHHLFFADLAIRTSSAGDFGGEVIPRYEAVILDEAHAAPDIATDYFGAQVSTYRVEDLCRDALRTLSTRAEMPLSAGDAVRRVAAAGAQFFLALTQAFPGHGDGRWPLDSTTLLPARGALDALEDALASLGRELAAGSADAEIAALERRARDVALALASVAAADDPAFVYWAERRGRGTFLHAAPIDVAKELAARLYDKVSAVVFTSATLAAGGSLDYFKRRVGLADEDGDLYPVREAILASPFDYAEQAALYLPPGLPEPADPRFVVAAAEEIRRLVEISEGRAFALFTSHKNMRECHDLLKDRLPWPTLLQGALPKAALLREFKSRPSVLFATQSFWEGVDVPGDALSMVIIDKLPFASPGDPLVAARVARISAAGGDPFGSYQVPAAALALKQGFGRLIRSRQDRGIVAILDRRIVKKGYGRTFLASLPPCPRFSELAPLEAWWRRTSSAC